MPIRYTDYNRGYLGRLDPRTGAVDEWPSPAGGRALPYGITSTGDGMIWYSESGTAPNTVVRFDPASVDLAEAYKYSKSIDTATAERWFGPEFFNDIKRAKEKLRSLQKSPIGPLASVEPLINDLSNMERAAEAKDTAEVIVMSRDAIAKSRQIYDHAQNGSYSLDTYQSLYHGSIILGEIGIICVQATSSKAASTVPIAYLTARAIESGLLLKLISEEQKQFSDLSQQAFDRQQKRRELSARLDALQEEKARLEWAFARAGKN